MKLRYRTLPLIILALACGIFVLACDQPAMTNKDSAKATPESMATKAADSDEVDLMRGFKGKIALDTRDSKPDWTPFIPKKGPEGAPNILFILYDDTGQAERSNLLCTRGCWANLQTKH